MQDYTDFFVYKRSTYDQNSIRMPWQKRIPSPSLERNFHVQNCLILMDIYGDLRDNYLVG